MINLAEIKKLYLKGENIMQALRSRMGVKENTSEIINISYDFQAGSYVEIFENNPEPKIEYCKQLASDIEALGDVKTILLVGTGESITLTNLAKSLNNKNICFYGIDISWSRIKFGMDFSKSQGVEGLNLFISDLFNLPFLDNSIDIVISNHSLEPNGGREKKAIQELMRVAKNYVVMNEPDYTRGNDEVKARIDHLGYVKNLADHSNSLGHNVIKDEPFKFSLNPMNPTRTTILKKSGEKNMIENVLACPVSKFPMEKYGDTYYSKESCLAYPIIGGIPCFLKESAIVATHFDDFFKDSK